MSSSNNNGMSPLEQQRNGAWQPQHPNGNSGNARYAGSNSGFATATARQSQGSNYITQFPQQETRQLRDWQHGATVTDGATAPESLVANETDWRRLSATLDLCTDEELQLKEGYFNTPQGHDPSRAQGTTGYPLGYQAGFEAADHSAHDPLDFDDTTVSVRAVLEEFQAFQAEGGIISTGHQGNAHLKSEEPKPRTSVALRQWIELEKRSSKGPKISIIRKLNVAYCIGKLFEVSNPVQANCSIDNFIVHESSDKSGLDSGPGWEVVGVDMITPPVSLRLTLTKLMGNGFEEVVRNKDIGRDVSPHIEYHYCPPVLQSGANEMPLCYELGSLLYVIFSEGSELNSAGHTQDRQSGDWDMDAAIAQPAKKQARNTSFPQASISESGTNGNAGSGGHSGSSFRPLIEYGCPYSVSQLVGDLLSCGDGLFRSDNSFKCLNDATDEIHLLLEEPCLLFDCVNDSGVHLLTLGAEDRLFGRSAETSQLINAYNRVASTEKSEVVMVAGYSGSGKTSLVQKISDNVKFANGYFVEKKFEEVSTQSGLTVVLSAFDEMTIQIAQSISNERRTTIRKSLTDEFSTNFQFLASTLPNVLLFFESNAVVHPSRQPVHICPGNLMSLCYTIQCYMAVISRCAGHGVIFLDDLHWADACSMILIQAILTSLADSKSILFVGSYRINDTNTCLSISDFSGLLSRLSVSLTTISLDDMSEKDVNLMVSDSLKMVPRICSPLSQVVVRKTKGCPFFIHQFLRALVDRDLLTYSLREKRWLWDVDKISAEPVTDNVLQLITSKMTLLSEDAQTALKVVACFGIKVKQEIVKLLSTSQQYCNLQQSIDDAVKNDFLEFDRVYYRFAHDKVRESACDLISTNSRNQYHFEIGMALYSSCMNLDEGQSNELLFATIEQVNYGVPSLLTSPSQRIAIAQLNYRAGLASMKYSNFVDVLTYSQAAHSLLPDNSWEVQYSLSLHVHYQLAKSAYACGNVDVAKTALNKIDQRARCLEDKLDAYDLLVQILQHQQEDISLALNTCCRTLKLLGEDVPNEMECSFLSQCIELAKTMICSAFTPFDSVLNMPRTRCKRTLDIMRFYRLLVFTSYTKGKNETNVDRGLLAAYYSSRWMSFLMRKQVVCGLTPLALACFACTIPAVYACTIPKPFFQERNCREAYRLGKTGLKILKENEDQAELPGTYLVFYGYVGVIFEPIQACVDMHKRGYEVGMQIGNTSDAFLNLFFLIPRMIECGMNLGAIQTEIESYQQLATTHSFPIALHYMQWYKDTIILLHNSESSPGIISPADSDQCKVTDATAIHLIQLIMPAVYLGQVERAQFLAKRWNSLDFIQKNRMQWRSILIAFYSGLALVGLCRRRKNKLFMSDIDKALSVLETASTLSQWNNMNKLMLLTAEKLSLKGKSKEAETKYNAAIKAAQSSKFIHEEALACELAGKYYETNGSFNKAIDLFCHAERCYFDWGSEIKASQMKKATERISPKGKKPSVGQGSIFG